MSALPWSPLTRAEIQARVDRAKSELAWYAAMVFEDAGTPTSFDVAYLRGRAEVLNGWHAADVARLGGAS